MSSGAYSQKATTSPFEDSSLSFPTGDNSVPHSFPEEKIRSFVFDLLKRSAEPGGEAAAVELAERIEDTGLRGRLVRAVVIEEFLLFEEATLRHLADDRAPHACFRFAKHVASLLTRTGTCVQEMTENQRDRLIKCIQGYLATTNSAEVWSAGATRLLEHTVALSNDLLVSAGKFLLTEPQRRTLGGAYLKFLSEHQAFFRYPEFSYSLVTPLDDVVQILMKLDTQRRGLVIRAFFERVNRLCKRFLYEDERADAILGDPIDLIGNLLDDEGSWPEREMAELSAEEHMKLDVKIDEIASDADNWESAYESEIFLTTDDPDEFLEDDEDEDHGDALYDDELSEWENRELFRDIEISEDADDADSIKDDFDTSELESEHSDAAVEVDLAARALKGLLAQVLWDCPSLQGGHAFWKELVFEESMFEPGSSFFTQGYARTSIDALRSLLIALPLSVRDEEAFVINFVALLAIEPELEQLYGMDIATAYKSAIVALTEHDDIQELQDEHGDSLSEAQYLGVLDLVDTAIFFHLESCLEAEWHSLQEISELGLDGDEMRTLLQRFIDRVWGKDS
jgi:hypothetical protein